MNGWIDEVDDGIVYGRTMINGSEFAFWVRLIDVMESQRVDLQPGSWVTIVNGELAVESVMWTTHDLELARERGKQLSVHFQCPQENASE